jgi:hypothetical protein
MLTSNCPQCGKKSDRILTEFDRVYPLPAVRVVRYQCTKINCQGEPNRLKGRERTSWDIVHPADLESLASALSFDDVEPINFDDVEPISIGDVEPINFKTTP